MCLCWEQEFKENSVYILLNFTVKPKTALKFKSTL